MNNRNNKIPSRRALLLGATAATLFAPSILRAQTEQSPVDRNIAAFRVHEWRDHFRFSGRGCDSGRYQIDVSAALDARW
ncbi:MAG: hypothetical protein ACMUJK_09915 [Rhodobacterales bacterium]